MLPQMAREDGHCERTTVFPLQYQQFESAVNEIRQIIGSSERPLAGISRAVELMSPLTSRVRPGPLRVVQLWRKVLLEAGVKENELNTYLRTK